MKTETLIVAGGGTGGHVSAGIAVAQHWKEKFKESGRVIFVGARGGIEERMIPKTGFPLITLNLGALNQVSLATRIKTLLKLPWAILRSIKILLTERPRAVIGVGGYASGPFLLFSRFFSRTAILEQNSVPGLTNRLLAKRSHLVFSAFPMSQEYFGNKSSIVVGNPVRPEITQASQAVTDPFCVFIFGGSQGAQGINTMVLEALPYLKGKKIRIVHQTGERDFERVLRGYQDAGLESAIYRVEKFIYQMNQVYSDASLVICRSGSSSLSELAQVGRAAVLIPFPQASDNHQEKNARLFSDCGAAILLQQSFGSGGAPPLAGIIEDLMNHPEKLRSLETRIKDFCRPNSAATIVNHLLK